MTEFLLFLNESGCGLAFWLAAAALLVLLGLGMDGGRDESN